MKIFNLKHFSQDQRYILISASTLILLSLTFYCINFFYFHYTGNNYIPKEMPGALLGLILLITGLYLLYGKKHFSFKMSMELLYFFMIITLIALLTNAVQYTPFTPIDNIILRFEHFFGIQLTDYIAWAHQYPSFIQILIYAYDSLVFQIMFFPLIMIMLRKTSDLRRYYFLMLNCTIIGFSFYYFFPTTAPASILESAYFMDVQRFTALKFYQVHHALPLTTLDGGMIALPSFHVIWAWLGVDLVKNVRWLFIPMIPINILLTLSCVFLGWHYFSDIMGSFIVFLLLYLSLSLLKSPSICPAEAEQITNTN